MKNKRNKILLLTIVIACLFCVCLSACQDKGKAAEVTSRIVGKTFSGVRISGEGYYEGKTTTRYRFKFIDESKFTVKREYEVDYDDTFFEGKINNVYETSEFTGSYAIKAYKNGDLYIFIEGYGSDGKDTSNNKKGLPLEIYDNYCCFLYSDDTFSCHNF